MKDQYARNYTRNVENNLLEKSARIRELEGKLDNLISETEELGKDLKEGITYLREAVAALYDHLGVQFVKTTEEVGTIDSSRGKLHMEERVTITAKKASKN